MNNNQNLFSRQSFSAVFLVILLYRFTVPPLFAGFANGLEKAEYTQADKKSVSSVESVSKLFFYEIRATRYGFDQGRSYLRPNSKNSKKFSDSLTPYFTTSYALRYPLSAVRYMLFLVPNAHLRPIVERRSFSAPVALASSQ